MEETTTKMTIREFQEWQVEVQASAEVYHVRAIGSGDQIMPPSELGTLQKEVKTIMQWGNPSVTPNNQGPFDLQVRVGDVRDGHKQTESDWLAPGDVMDWLSHKNE